MTRENALAQAFLNVIHDSVSMLYNRALNSNFKASINLMVKSDHRLMDKTR